MEISFDSREEIVYREFARLSRRTQESAECVVPDTDPDIGKIAAVQSAVLLKSKDLSSRGVLVTGELCAGVICISDDQSGVYSVKVRKPFTLEYETEGLESENLAQISLFLQGTDVRLINPRKLSVSFELEGILRCYCGENLCVESGLSADTQSLHVKTESISLTLPNAVCEKSVAINEQFAFPAGVAAPEKLLSGKASLLIGECQLLGSKMIVKGSAEITVCCLSALEQTPRVYTFSAPFSQIIDVGAEAMLFCAVRPEITGSYFDLIDAINGEKALDMELHAVLQLVCSEKRDVCRVTDAYSNQMPSELICSSREYALVSALRGEKLEARERVGLSEACGELLYVFPSVTRLNADADKLSAALTLDFLYRNNEDKLSSCRRTLTLSSDTGGAAMQILTAGPLRLETRADGEAVDCSVSLPMTCLVCEKQALHTVTGVILREDNAYLQACLPTLTLVRRGGESLWSLAKRYHSSEEKIREANKDADQTDRMLLIPKCV